jgi:hypothetical protein
VTGAAAKRGGEARRQGLAPRPEYTREDTTRANQFFEWVVLLTTPKVGDKLEFPTSRHVDAKQDLPKSATHAGSPVSTAP